MRVWSSSALVLTCLALTACGDGFDKKAAESCIRSAIEKNNDKGRALGTLFGKSNLAPQAQLRDLKFGECQKSAPGRHMCLVEYRVAFVGGDEGVKAFIGLSGALAGIDPNQIQQSYWSFTEGPQTWSCQLQNH